MLVEKSARILLCPHSSAPGVSTPISYITSSCSGNNQRKNPSPRLARNRSWPGNRVNLPVEHPWAVIQHHSTRCYASVSGPNHQQPSGSTVNHTWPSWPNPTPYDIFSHSKGARYNKALFYELVKTYHPDRHHTATDPSISRAVRLERYRLVVAANEILSDPVKRRAYDLHGAGWGGNRSLKNLYRETDRSWRDEPGNASGNATWEDWDRWYRERDGEKQPEKGIFMSNELFVVVLCSFVVLGSLTQARRAHSSTANLVEIRDQKHAEISEDMRRRQIEKAPLNHDERVEMFLRHRDSWAPVSSTHGNSTSASQGK